jgi:hypothetical protein
MVLVPVGIIYSLGILATDISFWAIAPAEMTCTTLSLEGSIEVFVSRFKERVPVISLVSIHPAVVG